MKNISLRGFVIVLFAVLGLSACGGGSSSSPVASEPTTAVLSLSTTATSTIPAGTTINSYLVTITLPAGVTVSTVGSSQETEAGVVSPAGVASSAMVSGVYTAATSSLPGTVKVYVASYAGFNPGLFCTVKGNLAAGSRPTAADFKPTLDDATGIYSSPSASTVILTGSLSLTATVAIQ